MCYYEQTNIACRNPTCDEIIYSRSKNRRKKCKTAHERRLKWGECPVSTTPWQLPALKSDRHECITCQTKRYQEWLAAQQALRERAAREERHRERSQAVDQAIEEAEAELAAEIAADGGVNTGSSSGYAGTAAAHEEFAITSGIGAWVGGYPQDLHFDFLDQQPENTGEGSSQGQEQSYGQGAGDSYYGYYQ